MIDWIESSFINTNYAWQWTQPIESDWVLIRHSITQEYQDALNIINERRFNRGRSGIELWGKICQGGNAPFLQSFNEQRIYQNTSKAEIFYFPRPPILLPNERRIGIQGQRYYKFNNPAAYWIVHVFTPVIPINATLPDYTHPVNGVLSPATTQQIAADILAQIQLQAANNPSSNPNPVTINLL